MPRRRILLFLLLTYLCGCVRRPPNENCDWYDSRSGPLDLSKAGDRSHLLQDIETSEDLAVRFMDSHHAGTVDGPSTANGFWNQCFVKLASTISAEHRITPAQLMSEFGQRPAGLDLAVGIGWGLIYAWASSLIATWIWRRQGSGTAGIVMASYVALVAAVLGVLLGEQWSGMWETLRTGNGHLSYRVQQIPWGHHEGALFGGALVTFCVVAALRYRVATHSVSAAPAATTIIRP